MDLSGLSKKTLADLLRIAAWKIAGLEKIGGSEPEIDQQIEDLIQSAEDDPEMYKEITRQNMKIAKEDSFHAMKLSESRRLNVDNFMDVVVVRVPGGWVMMKQYDFMMCFIPLSDEFKFAEEGRV